jgi:hypothetical protein
MIAAENRASIRNELSVVRTELQELKKCQLAYILASVSAASAVFGFSNKVVENNLFHCMMFLVPLLVILPCWMTFFDKANSITRMAGYCGVLESELQVDEDAAKRPPYYLGLETSLLEFREVENRKVQPTSWRLLIDEPANVFKAIVLLTRHRYWTIGFHTFFLLAFACLILTWVFGSPSEYGWLTRRSITFWAVVVNVVIVFLVTFKKWMELIVGKYSYTSVTEFWKNEVVPLLIEKAKQAIANSSANTNTVQLLDTSSITDPVQLMLANKINEMIQAQRR